MSLQKLRIYESNLSPFWVIDSSTVHCIAADYKANSPFVNECQASYGVNLRDVFTDMGERPYPDCILYHRDLFLISSISSNQRPSYHDLTEAIHNMALIADDYQMRTIIIPKYQNGFGSLKWDVMKDILKEKCRGLECEIYLTDYIIRKQGGE